MNGIFAKISILALIFLVTPCDLLARTSRELVDQPMVIRSACPDAASGEEMLGAAYLAMKQFKWEVQSAQTDYFRAKYCRGGPSGFCMTVDVFFLGDKLEFWLSPQSPRNKDRKTVVSWIGRVQSVFGDYQCGDPNALIEASNSLARRKKPTWASNPYYEEKLRETGRFRRWFEWHDKYRPKAREKIMALDVLYCVDVLTDADRPMHVSILVEALARKGMGTSRDNLSKLLTNNLAPNGPFIRTAPNTFGLAVWEK